MNARSLRRPVAAACLALVAMLGASCRRAGERSAPAPVAGEVATIEPPSKGLHLGDSAPESSVKMVSVDGRSVAIDDVRGKSGTLVYFTCNHCPYARAWEARLVALGNEYLDHGIGVIAINSNDPAPQPDEDIEQMKQRATDRGMRYPYVVDATSQVARAFGAVRTPETFVFDAEGHLRYHGTGDDNAQDETQVTQRYLRDALAAVVSGQEVPVTETKSMGCAIRYRPAS